MQIAEGSLGRIFAVRLEEGDAMPGAVERVARERNIHSALVFLVGGARDGALVMGPEHTADRPPIPMIQAFSGAHEIVGWGTLFEGADGPSLHMHAAVGRGDTVLAGCIRPGFKTFLVGEIVILELLGLGARRVLDPETGFHLLSLPPGSPSL